MLIRLGGIVCCLSVCGLLAWQGNDCAVEFENARGVWLSHARFVPFYNDLELARWLTSLYERSRPERPAVVLPVYSRDSLLLADGHRIYISTAAILQFQIDGDLAVALASAPRAGQRRRGPAPPDCSLPASGPPMTSLQLRTRLERQVAAYQSWTEKVLRIRATPAPAAGSSAEMVAPGAEARRLAPRPGATHDVIGER